jgi:RNA polymerase sigma factor (sigma-70 family)
VGGTDDELYRKHAEELTAFATGLVGPNHAADVVSDAVLRCLSSRRWATVTNKRAYLYRGVFNEAAMFHRSTRRRRTRESSSDRMPLVSQPEFNPEIAAAVARLSVRQRAVIVLTYWGDLDPQSIAALLNISDGSVRRHLARARANLREVLESND